MFDLIYHFIPSTWWSVWLICLIVFRWYWLKGFVIELRQHLSPRVTFDRSLVTVFLSGQDLSPPFIERIMFGFELLMFLFQAPGCSNELSLEAFLFEGFLWDDKIIITKANILFGDR